MLFKDLVFIIDELERTNSRNLMTEQLAEFLRKVEMQEVAVVCYLLLGRLGPLFAQIDFGVADKMAIKSLARMAELTEDKVLKRYKELGDMGEATQEFKESGKMRANEGLSVKAVYERLKEIALANGEGSQEIKIDLLANLLQQASSLEAKYIIRMVLGKMRLGFSDKTILDALAVMDGGSKQGREALNWAYQVYPDIGHMAGLVKKYGVGVVQDKVQATVGVPVLPCLAQRLRSADEMILKMKKVVVEPKYDGTRVQIHYDKKQYILKTYARSLEETTSMFPELTEGAKQIKANSVIFDGEAVGYDPDTGELKNFQETITRKRKYGVKDLSKTIPIKFFCFDVLFFDGESLIQKPLYERRKILEQTISGDKVLVVDPLIVTTSADEVREFHKKQLSGGLEGAMVKQYDGEYNPGRTGWNWVKFKEAEDTQGKLSDTIDGIVMGYYRGKGKRSVFGMGAFLLGILNQKSGFYETVAKVGTGLTDEQWREMKRKTDVCFSMDKPKLYRVKAGLEPDVWTEPVIVVEIAADEITQSPMHSSGWGLRFPRLIRFREDKRADQATVMEELLQIK